MKKLVLAAVLAVVAGLGVYAGFTLTGTSTISVQAKED